MSKTWEQTIQHIRSNPDFKTVVEGAYLDENLVSNVERFRKSQEFSSSLELLKPWLKKETRIADIGSGNGISAVSFALEGFHVTSIEPDPSNTVGAGAQHWLSNHYRLNNLEIIESFGEKLPLPDESFDIVYIRQAMHHAHHLNQFIAESARLLKKGGILLTVRDHVILNQADKEWFLNEHPLHRFYGGENAFTAKEYRAAMVAAGLDIIRELKYYDSPINYFPLTSKDIEAKIQAVKEQRRSSLRKKIGPLAEMPGVMNLYHFLLNLRSMPLLDENRIPGRLYSYLCIKPV
jgi:ubiquinone/menaquinone biosynthesis C-methylase UbiE